MSASRFAPIVLLHPEETHFPMHPLEFISISRFRHHIGWGQDFGYKAEIEGSCNEVQGEMIVLLSTPFEPLFNRNYLSKHCLVCSPFRQCF